MLKPYAPSAHHQSSASLSASSRAFSRGFAKRSGTQKEPCREGECGKSALATVATWHSLEKGISPHVGAARFLRVSSSALPTCSRASKDPSVRRPGSAGHIRKNTMAAEEGGWRRRIFRRRRRRCIISVIDIVVTAMVIRRDRSSNAEAQKPQADRSPITDTGLCWNRSHHTRCRYCQHSRGERYLASYPHRDLQKLHTAHELQV